VLGLAMATSLVLVTPLIAGAKDAPTPMQQYRVALLSYDHQRSVINKDFNAAIAYARAVERAALASAKTAVQKSLARNDFNETRATDVVNWETALQNLGSPPLPPVATRAPNAAGSAPTTHPTTTLPGTTIH